MKRNITIYLLFVVLFPIANAAVSVESFTCNGMSGTVVVENGATFSCQASIKNEDTQNSANIGSVSLMVSGSWTETTSYAGTGFSTTVGAGASTAATFSGMKSVTPGATNKFQSILIDSSSDTFVADTNVNVVTIKTITVSTSASSVEEGNEFEISATVIAGGDLSSVTLTWSGSGGCAVSSGHTASKNVGTLSHNGEASRSWAIIQGVSDCVNTITASGTSSSVTVTKPRAATVSEPNADSGPSSGTTTTGGGGSGGGASTTQTKTIKEIKAGTSSTVSFTKAVDNIYIEVLNDVRNVVISVGETTSPGVTLLEGAYKYIEIKAANISDSDIKSAIITFSVNKTWLSGKDKNSVRLNRYAGGWKELATVILSEDESSVKYTATTPGFSIFAITVKAPSGEQPAQGPSGPLDMPTETETGTGDIQTPSGGPESGTGGQQAGNYDAVYLLIVLIVVGVMGWYYFHGSKKRKYSYDHMSEKKWSHKH